MSLALVLMAGCDGEDIRSLPEAQGGGQPFYGNFAIANDKVLYEMDLPAATATPIGVASANTIEGLAISATGVLFATDVSGNLSSIDRLTGAATSIGPTIGGDVEGLDFGGGTLIATNIASPPTFFSIDVATGTPTAILNSTVTTGPIICLAVQSPGVIYFATGGPTLWKADVPTATITQIGVITIPGATAPLTAAMDFAADGNLYGLGSDGTVMTIDPNTAIATVRGNTGGHFWLGMAASP